MKKNYFLLAVLFTMAVSVYSQTLADYQFSTGHDASRWYTLDSTRNLIVMTGSRYYRRSALEEIGFAFPFADTSYTQFSVTHDGNLRLGSALAISSSSNQGSPFVASRAGSNNPKINFMGCAGYSSDSIYVHRQLFGTEPERVMVVEFALQTYITSSRPSLLRWQVQMHENGDIQIVYPSQRPPIYPNCNHQQGMCVDETDIWIVDQYHVATHYTEGYPTHIPGGNWPDTNRYYRFDYPNDVCVSPSELVAAIIDMNSVTLSWNGDATSYIVEYSTSSFVPGTGSASQVVVSDNTAYIAGLQGGTQYHFYVRSICGTGDTSNATYVAARTLTVEPVTATYYFCDFESAEERAGWIIPTGNIPTRWYLGTAANNTQNGQYALYVSQDSGATNTCGDNWIGTYAYRSFNLEAGDWELTFDWRAYGDWMTNSAGNTTFYQFLRAFLVPSSITLTTQSPPLFPVPNATPHGTAVPQGWIELNPTTHSFVNQSTWTTYSTTVAVGTPGCYNLVFYWETDGYDPPVDLPGAIDNISLEYLDCASPQSLTASSSDNDILLSWHRGGNENVWRVVCGNIDMIVNDTFCFVSGLEFNTLYHFDVYAICGDGDTSNALSASFRTTAGEPVTEYPYYCDFEDSLIACHWVTLGENQANAWYVGPAANNTPQGEKALYVSQDGGATNSYTGSARSLSYAYRMVALDTNDYLCSFDWRCLGDNDFHFMRAFIVPSTSIPAAGTFPMQSNLHISVPSGWIDLYPEHHYLSGDSNWTTFIHPFHIADSGLYALLFMWENDEFTPGNPPAAVDNITITFETCPSPTGLSAHATQTYIDLTWDDVAGAMSWLVEYADTIVTSYSPSYNAENLTPNTEYTFRVSRMCQNGDTSLPAILTLHTTCTPVESLPFFCDFSEYAVGTGSSNDFIPCWNRLRNHSGFSPQVSNSFTEGDNYLYWNLTSGLLDDAIIVLPELAETIEVTYTELHFKAMKMEYLGVYTDPVLIVGVMSDPTNMDAFASLDTIVVTNEGSFVEYTVPMLSYTGSDQFIAIRCIVDTPLYTATICLIDDIALYELDLCRRPTSYSAEAGIDTALLSWTPGGNETQWQLSYADTVLTTSYPYHIATGLESDREYLFFVRSICGPGDTSDAITGRFRTLPTTPNPPDTTECPAVFNVVATQNDTYDPYMMTICWDGEASDYEIVVSNIDDNSVTYSAIVHDSTCHLFDFEGQGGSWSIVVRSICENGMYGEWSEPVLYNTPTCIGLDVPVETSEFTLYPNPSNGSTTLIVAPSNSESIFRITVVDLSGRTVIDRDVEWESSVPVTIPLEGLSSGSYFVKLTTATNNTVKKLIIK